MRFLCLHGLGTSSQIFKTQTAALRYELGDDHIYEFVQGSVPWPMATGLAGISDPEKLHWGYFDPANLSSCAAALDQLGVYLAIEGPFDGVMGFSQGALLAIAYMVRYQHENPQAAQPFKCAILIASTNACELLDLLRAETIPGLPVGVTPINLPAAVIVGEQDTSSTGDENTTQLFDRNTLSVFVHGGGHEAPGPNIPNSLTGSVKVIRRAVFQGQHVDAS
ncbi:serine hydrolase FSH [Phaeosphaeriaceae sp. PMI808]|nr:serine hydrolase FSH [Phaeosphaeriaceae sp. PMI808]